MNGSNSISPFTDVDMELAAVNEDDIEPAKELSAGGTVDYEECALQERFDQLSLSEGQFTIVIGGHELVCEEALLVGGCKYFEALIHFEDSRRIHFKGGVNFKTLKAIVNFLSTRSLEIDLENCQVFLNETKYLNAFLLFGRISCTHPSFCSAKLPRTLRSPSSVIDWQGTTPSSCITLAGTSVARALLIKASLSLKNVTLPFSVTSAKLATWMISSTPHARNYAR